MTDYMAIAKQITEAHNQTLQDKHYLETHAARIEIALVEAQAWIVEMETAIHEAVDNEDLGQLAEVNKRISCPKCGDRKCYDDEACETCYGQ